MNDTEPVADVELVPAGPAGVVDFGRPVMSVADDELCGQGWGRRRRREEEHHEDEARRGCHWRSEEEEAAGWKGRTREVGTGIIYGMESMCIFSRLKAEFSVFHSIQA